PAVAETYRVAGDLTQDYHFDGMPFWTRGGMRVRHNFPVQGEYTIKVTLRRNINDIVRGLQEPHVLELTLGGARIKRIPLPFRPEVYKTKGTTNSSDALKDALTADAGLQIRQPIAAGPHVLDAAFEKESAALEEGFEQPFQKSFIYPLADDGLPHVASVTID